MIPHTGELRDRIDIAFATRTGEGETWTVAYSNVPARCLLVSGAVIFTSQQAQANARWDVTVRYNPAFTVDMQITLGSRTLNVSAIRDVVERYWQVLECEEQADSGA